MIRLKRGLTRQPLYRKGSVLGAPRNDGEELPTLEEREEIGPRLLNESGHTNNYLSSPLEIKVT